MANRLREEKEIKLFDILPDNFFSILSSKNRELYIEALFLLQDCFSADELIIRRDYYAERLRDKLGALLNSSDLEEEEEENTTGDLITDKASLIIRRLSECGWVIVEMIENQFDYQIFLTSYASDILNTLRKLTEDENKTLERNIRSSYALLKTASEPMDKLESLEAAVDNFRDFEKELIKVYTNIRSFHQECAELENVNDLLTAFLKNYQENIDRRYISPLSRSNSVERYRTEIKSIITSWLSSDSFELVKRAWVSKYSEKDANLASEMERAEEVINRSIIYIEDHLDTKLPLLVGKIKEKDSIYKERTISRIMFKSRSGKNIKKALMDLIRESQQNDSLMDEMRSSFSLSSVSIYDRYSLYQRKEREKINSDDELRITRGSGDEEELKELFSQMRSLVSNDEIDAFVFSAMKERDEADTKDFNISSLHDFTLFILSAIRADEWDAPYRIYREDGSTEINGAMLPCFKFRRKNA